MADLFKVKLDVQDDKNRRDFEGVLNSQEFRRQFRLLSSGATESPDLVILEMRRSCEEVLQRAAPFRNDTSTTEVFITSLRSEPEEIKQLYRENINDFISLPVKDYEVKKAFERFVQRKEQVEHSGAALGKVLNIMGSKGGIGTTTIAINLAVSLKRKDAKRRVALVDLNDQFGDIALFMRLEPKLSIVHAAQHIDQNDQLSAQKELMQRVLGEHDSGVNVLSAAKVDEDREALTPHTVNKMVGVLRSMFDYVILDSGHMLDEITIEMMRHTSGLYLVSTLHLPVIRNTARFLKYLSSFDRDYHENTKIIMNRQGSMHEEISARQFVKEYKKDIFFSIPNEYALMSKLINDGRTIKSIFRWNKLARSFRRLAAKVA